MDGYVGLFGLTECCGGQQNSKRQDLHEYDSNNPLNPINDPFAVVLLVSYRRWLQKGKIPRRFVATLVGMEPASEYLRLAM
jgi:hypothetical protein